jgi:hypothetical protein
VSAAPDAPSTSALKAMTEATQADVLDTESVLFQDAPLASEGARSSSGVCFVFTCRFSVRCVYEPRFGDTTLGVATVARANQLN